MQNYNKDELYHYGVPGMRWGRRKSALNRQNSSNYKGKGLTVSQASRQAKKDKKTQKPKDATDKYFEKTKTNTRLKRIGYGSTIVGAVMTSIGKNMYNKHKYNASRGKVAAINILGYGGKALSGIGPAVVTAANIKQVSDANKWLHGK